MAHPALFLTMYEAIRSVRREASWTRQRAETYSDEVFTQLARQHQTLTEAIINGDPAKAEAAMTAHLRTVAETLAKV